MVEYRRARLDDAPHYDRIVRAAYNNLSRQRGFPETPPGPPNPFTAFTLAEEAEGCWVAEQNGMVIGVTAANLRSPLWYLAYLFVDPDSQETGIGGELLRRALTHGGQDAAMRGLITFAYNPVSISLYLRYGMLPVEPLYAQETTAAAVRERLAGREMLQHERVDSGDGAAGLLAAIDSSVLGIDRLNVHRYLLQLPGTVCHVFAAAGEPRGYAYVSTSGRVGPVAAAAPLSFERVLQTALLTAAASSAGMVSVTLPGSNGPAMRLAIEAGMRIATPMLLMASRRFGDLDCYAFHGPGLM